MLKPDELRNLAKPSPLHTWVWVLTDWLMIGLIFFAADRVATLPALLRPLIFAVAWVLIARYQLALAILMHDAAHSRLFISKKWNDWVGQLFCASPLFFSMETYRKFHLKHHQDPLAPDDPDLSLIGGYPIPGESLARKLLRDLVGISYFKFIKYFFFRGRAHRKANSAPPALGPEKRRFGKAALTFMHLAVNGLIFFALWKSGHPWFYLTLWLLPMMTALQVLLRIRGIAEHAGYQPNKQQQYNSRTVVNPLQAYFFAPHNVNYHIEHHVYPGIPFANLPQAHALMKARGALPEANYFTSYWAVMASVTN